MPGHVVRIDNPCPPVEGMKKAKQTKCKTNICSCKDHSRAMVENYRKQVTSMSESSLNLSPPPVMGLLYKTNYM